MLTVAENSRLGVFPPPLQKISQPTPPTSTAQWACTLFSYENRGGRLVGKYFPYGQDRGSSNPSNGTEKFATYKRDAETGLDYARARYHAPGDGRFLSPDPYKASGGPADPGSWNRYAYTRGDPVNRVDGAGTLDCDIEKPDCYCQLYGPGSDLGYDPHCDPFFSPFSGQPQGQQPAQTESDQGASTLTLPELFSTAVQGVMEMLQKDTCAKDFKDMKDVLNKLDHIGTADLGIPEFVTKNGQIVEKPRNFLQRIASPCYGAAGCYNPVTGSINLNERVNWLDPDNSLVIIDGRNVAGNLLQGESQQLGVSLNPLTFMQLTMLHELFHYKGAIKNPDGTTKNPDNDPEVEKSLWNDCIK